MKAIIFDTETTDSQSPEIIEAAWTDARLFHVEEEVMMNWYRFKPSKPITLGAMSTHHIMEEDLVDCPDSSTFQMPKCDYLIGHNIDFDWKAAGAPNVKRIDTLALARMFWPEADCHTQSSLLYLLDRENARKTLKNAHNAACDVLICQTILYAIVQKSWSEDWEHLWEVSEKARIPVVMPYGKHKGVPMKDVPSDYKRWLLGQPDVDDYLRIALGGKPAEKRLL